MSQVPDEMVLATMTEATRQCEELSAEDATQYVRDFVALMQTEFLTLPPGVDPDDATVQGYSSLLAAALFQECFVKAYRHAESHVDNVERLNRMYDQ